MTDERGKVLESAIAQIEKQYGKGSIMRLGNRDVLVPVSVIPTGALSIDAALGVGGVPRGREQRADDAPHETRRGEAVHQHHGASAVTISFHVQCTRPGRHAHYVRIDENSPGLSVKKKRRRRYRELTVTCYAARR